MKHIFLSLICLVSLSNFALAENTQTKAMHKNHKDNYTSQNAELCSQVWKNIWPKAKRGDLEARFQLLGLLSPPPDMDFFELPGNNGDWISTLRDFIIVGVHTSDYFATSTINSEKQNLPLLTSYKSTITNFVEWVSFGKTGRGKKFLECFKNNEMGCSDIAIKEKFVPTFQDFSNQIDANIRKGIFGSCKNYFSKK